VGGVGRKRQSQVRSLIHGGLGWGNNAMFIVAAWMFAMMTGRVRARSPPPATLIRNDG
jgi:hypothetical protein